jgi:tetratricopeptide (TPR) repeat protein
LVLVGIAIGSLFLLTHDWYVQPNALSSINTVAQKWVQVRPRIDLATIDHNQAGGLIAMGLPFPIAMMARAWKENRRVLAVVAFGIGMLLVVFLLMTGSRGAWLASIVGFGVWFLWEGAGWIARSLQASRSKVFFLFLFIGIGIPALILSLQYNEELSALIERFPGGDTSGSRLPLFIDTLHLIDDFSILGGGLGSFPGLYSQYIKLLPFYYLGYSHNLYLDVTLEQGIFGLFSIVIILFGSAWLIINNLRDSQAWDGSYLLSWAVLVSLIIVILHGFVDDPLYGEKGTPYIFLLCGLSIALTQSSQVRGANKILAFLDRSLNSPLVRNRRTLLLGVASLFILLFLFFGFSRPVLAELYANLGAVQMARTELISWPTRKWAEDTDVSTLQPAKQWFDRSLELDPDNETSHYRLGLISMRAQDFQNSQGHLETAHASDLDHPGLLKSLGYSYLWSGKLSSGAQLLKGIPEADHELLVYIGWWENHGKMELSKRAISGTLLLRMIRTIDREYNKK